MSKKRTPMKDRVMVQLARALAAAKRKRGQVRKEEITEDMRKLVIARIKAMSPNLRLSIG
jgi:hypothetical protein